MESPKEKHAERVRIQVRKVLGHVAKAAACFGTKRHFEPLD